MSSKILLALGCAAFLGTASLAADAPKPSCCAKKAKETAMTGKMRCSLTGKVVDKCCCEQRDGKLYCPLAKKAVEKCCCTPVKGEGKAAENRS